MNPVDASACGRDLLIRRATPEESAAIAAMVLVIALETFGSNLVPQDRISEEDWSPSWLAIVSSEVAGVVLTREEWIGDLWVRREYRNRGIGGALLLRGESEIAARGHRVLRLRVVKSNTRAVDFYRHLGWQIEREFPHETLPTTMIEMSKPTAGWCD
jgi:ribosomal protein S18 acetylase RimI-like enzyme